MVEEMLAARGISVTYETIRQWCLKFGREFANRIRRRAPRRGDKSHLDEVVITIAGDQKHHARKPKPSAETDARPELGSLCESACRWDSGWIKWTITKITPTRVFVYKHRKITTADGISSVLTFENDTQRSFDRATLEKDGRAFYKNGTGSSFFYTDAGKAKEEADFQTREGAPVFPLLGLPRSATRVEVLTAFRNLAKTAHPDAGGDAAAFRELVAEKNRALVACR